MAGKAFQAVLDACLFWACVRAGIHCTLDSYAIMLIFVSFVIMLILGSSAIMLIIDAVILQTTRYVVLDDVVRADDCNQLQHSTFVDTDTIAHLVTFPCQDECVSVRFFTSPCQVTVRLYPSLHSFLQ